MPFPLPGDLPDSGIELVSLASPASAGGFFTTDFNLLLTSPNNILRILVFENQCIKFQLIGFL